MPKSSSTAVVEKKKTTSTTAKKVVKEAKKTVVKEVKESSVKAEKVSPKNSVKKATNKIPKDKFYGTGKRKTAIARVWLFKGAGKITMNDLPILEYIKNPLLVQKINYPLLGLELADKFDVVIKAHGGGLAGQADAAVLGLSRALLSYNPEFKNVLKDEGLLTRDARIKERKKYGCKRARKGFQFRKR